MSKKMCPKNDHREDKIEKKSRLQVLHEAIGYEPPIYKKNKSGYYIELRAFDPAKGELRRKRIKLNHITPTSERNKYAKGLIKRLNERLATGWNPWIDKNVYDLKQFDEALERYEEYIERMGESGYYREETYKSYRSFINVFKEYLKTHPLTYLYQFDRSYCSRFLDYIFIEKNRGAQTRNNYLGYLGRFGGWLVEKGYLDNKPTEGIRSISKRLITKGRDCIPLSVVKQIMSYMQANDPYFGFACMLLYYCFIRPVEMTRLKVSDINLHDGTITIQADSSKNKKTQSVKLPLKVIQYGLDIGIFSMPVNYYLFGYGDFRPGANPTTTKIMRDHWERARRALGMDKRWKFYSLKDTGITEMLDNNVPTIQVRDQARHSSIAITDLYTDKRDRRPSQLDYDGGSL